MSLLNVKTIPNQIHLYEIFYVEISGKKCKKWKNNENGYNVYIDELYTKLNEILIEQSIFHFWSMHRKCFECPMVVKK